MCAEKAHCALNINSESFKKEKEIIPIALDLMAKGSKKVFLSY